MKIIITEQSFDPWQEVARHQRSLATDGRIGAIAVFVGTMRNINEGDSVTGMTLEHYPGMTERQLQKICTQAMEKWPVQEVLVIHRVGELLPDDPIVLVAVWSGHRAEAYDANRFIMEYLKSAAPFWKKEILPDGTRWVERNT
ncbi:MAG: molybdenum cofactor biosynthesis protein MoaE [Saprospiraceae bacterium]|nr:molybdenum cofactor biosynthesis protein MoaE [Saprospiraceae bacterium]